MRWPGCLPWTIHCCSTKLHPGRASYCEHFPPGESEITALVHTVVWKLGSGGAGTLARRELNRLSSSRRLRRKSSRQSILVKANVLQIQRQQCTCLTRNTCSPPKQAISSPGCLASCGIKNWTCFVDVTGEAHGLKTKV